MDILRLLGLKQPVLDQPPPLGQEVRPPIDVKRGLGYGLEGLAMNADPLYMGAQAIGELVDLATGRQPGPKLQLPSESVGQLLGLPDPAKQSVLETVNRVGWNMVGGVTGPVGAKSTASAVRKGLDDSKAILEYITESPSTRRQQLDQKYVNSFIDWIKQQALAHGRLATGGPGYTSTRDLFGPLNQARLRVGKDHSLQSFKEAAASIVRIGKDLSGESLLARRNVLRYRYAAQVEDLRNYFEALPARHQDYLIRHMPTWVDWLYKEHERFAPVYQHGKELIAKGFRRESKRLQQQGPGVPQYNYMLEKIL